MNLNPENYGTLEACQALEKAGIVMETEKLWFFYWGEWHDKPAEICRPIKTLPRPMWTEVWRELPMQLEHDKRNFFLMITQCFENTVAEYASSWEHIRSLIIVKNTNPTDALIYLCIWLEKREGEKG
jgi:hypothetical protein